jgi:DNA-binding GntR family transcriptional regulator
LFIYGDTRTFLHTIGKILIADMVSCPWDGAEMSDGKSPQAQKDLINAGTHTDEGVAGDSGGEGISGNDDGARILLTRQVANVIRDMIIQDDIKPGERIRERQLADQLKVSRTPLREALKILESEKLVVTLPNRGAVVADPEPQDVRGLLQLLGALEALGGRLACENATDQEIAEVQALHHEMLAAFYRNDRLGYFKLNQLIHLKIIATSSNAALIETHAQINARVYRARYRSNQRNEKWHEAIEQHESIITALQDRRGEQLSEILFGHLGQTWIKVSAQDYAEDPDADTPDAQKGAEVVSLGRQ